MGSGVFFLFFISLGGAKRLFFRCVFPPFLKWVILDYMAHGSIIWVPAGTSTVITLRAILGELAEAPKSRTVLLFVFIRLAVGEGGVNMSTMLLSGKIWGCE